MKQKLFVSVFVHKYLIMLNKVEYTTFKMSVTQMSKYFFVISFQVMFYDKIELLFSQSLTWPATSIGMIR